MRWAAVAAALALLATATAVAGDRPGLEPTDPLAPTQWYLERTRALAAWTTLPPLAPVRVAVIDSGVDLGHPDLAGRIVAAKSFVGGGAKDTRGHGTVVAGVIAAQLDNGIGIAGLAPSAQLVVAKVVDDEGSISVRAEARAIRWAVAQGARIVSMSLSGVRDPQDSTRDTFSRLEAAAIRYAVSRGVLVVAAVGNGDQAPRQPWPYAGYPAALPHVLGVSALGRHGAAPGFSNRDPLYNDLAAPGEAIASTFPRALTSTRRACPEQGYTRCANDDFRRPEGTSFAAPQVAAVAANLIATRPSLRPEQVAALLTRSARDASAATGCTICPPGRDAFTGWGELDGAAALDALVVGPLPPPDANEPNDDAGLDAYPLYFAPGRTSRGTRATLDYWDDGDDVYAVHLTRGDRLYASLGAPAGSGDFQLAIWRPGTTSITEPGGRERPVVASTAAGARQRLAWTALQTGRHYLHARLATKAGPVGYRLSIVRASG